MKEKKYSKRKPFSDKSFNIGRNQSLSLMKAPIRLCPLRPQVKESVAEVNKTEGVPPCNFCHCLSQRKYDSIC